MMNVFISGSRTITQFDRNIVFALYDELNSNIKILVGDADGVDSAIQRFCSENKYSNITVFATNGKVRNNIGSFSVHNVLVNDKTYFREFYTQKDILMTSLADYGIVIWDGKSKGSFKNIERIIKQNKPCFLYLMSEKKWITVENETVLQKLNLLRLSDEKQKYTQLSFF